MSISPHLDLLAPVATLAMFAYAFLAITRLHEAASPENTADRMNTDAMIPLTCNEIRHLLSTANTPETTWKHRISWSLW